MRPVIPGHNLPTAHRRRREAHLDRSIRQIGRKRTRTLPPVSAFDSEGDHEPERGVEWSHEATDAAADVRNQRAPLHFG